MKNEIIAVGFNLTADQQEAIAELWRWQERSLKSKQLLGGPLGEFDGSGERETGNTLDTLIDCPPVCYKCMKCHSCSEPCEEADDES